MLMIVFTLLAAQALDFEMSLQEKKTTGITKLNEPEKKSLQEWINNNYERRNEPLVKADEAGRPILQETLNNGRFIRLSDNSLWEIQLKDTAITQSWITPVEIFVTQSGNADYPFKLTNSLTGSSVLARRASSAPSVPAAPTRPPKT